MAEEPPPLFGDEDENVEKEEDDEDLFKSATEVMKTNTYRSYRNHLYVHSSFQSIENLMTISLFLCLVTPDESATD